MKVYVSSIRAIITLAVRNELQKLQLARVEDIVQ